VGGLPGWASSSALVGWPSPECLPQCRERERKRTRGECIQNAFPGSQASPTSRELGSKIQYRLKITTAPILSSPNLCHPRSLVSLSSVLSLTLPHIPPPFLSLSLSHPLSFFYSLSHRLSLSPTPSLSLPPTLSPFHHPSHYPPPTPRTHTPLSLRLPSSLGLRHCAPVCVCVCVCAAFGCAVLEENLCTTATNYKQK